jgi:hypothetical protein
MAVGATDPWARNMGASPRVRRGGAAYRLDTEWVHGSAG